MIHLVYGNRTEALLTALAERVAARTDVLTKLHIVVPNRQMERYVELGLARTLGIAGNLAFSRLERFTRDWLVRATGTPLADGEVLEGLLLSVLLDDTALAAPALAPVRQYVDVVAGDEDARDLRRFQLATHLAHLFEEYGFSRPELLEAWRKGQAFRVPEAFVAAERWERALFDAAMKHAQAHALPTSLAEGALPRAARGQLPQTVHVFGLSYVARLFQRVFARMAHETELFVYTLNPCAEFWEDVKGASNKGAAHRTGVDVLAPDASDDPFGLLASNDPAALRSWGRPGREGIRLLDELTEGDFQAAFVDPAAATRGTPTALHALQHRLYAREPDVDTLPNDGSIRIVAAASPRREVEFVADDVWRAIAAEPSLRFHDIAIVVHSGDRDAYLPHLAAAFHEAHALPYHVLDVPLERASAVVDAALRLLELPSGELERRAVLDVLTHPVVVSRYPELDPQAWDALVTELGVVRGAGHADLGETFVTRDLYTFGQAAQRLALGHFLEGEETGESRPFVLSDERYFPEDRVARDELHGKELGVLIRAICADSERLRRATLPLDAWAEELSTMISAYLTPRDALESLELRRVLTAIASISSIPLTNPASFRIAAELAKRALRGLTGSSGEALADGVAVTTFLPMRAIPFRRIYLLGLGEGRFPAEARRDSLDLRSARRVAGDVSAPERDKYAFLETLLCARDALVVSYVARNAETGDRLAPSPIVVELAEMCAPGRTPRDALAMRTEVQPLRRWDAPDVDQSAFSAARLEARAARLGEVLRAEVAGGESLSLAHVERALAEHAEVVRGWLGPAVAREAPRPHIESVSDAKGPERVERVELSVSALRRFLECPLQGWASHVLRVQDDSRDDDDGPLDEPLSPGFGRETLVLRGAFLDAHRERGSAAKLYAQLVDRYEAAGEWPTGVLRERQQARHLQQIAQWERELADLAGGSSTRLYRTRFGRGSERAAFDRAEPALGYEVVLPHGTRKRVELYGGTEAWCGERAAVSVLRSPGGQSENDRRVARIPRFLRGFLDHVLLSASGLDASRAHEAWLLQLGATAERAVFAPLDRDAAQGWLAAVTTDILAEPHAYYAPLEAYALALAEGELTHDTYADAIDSLTRDPRLSTSRFGPIASAERFASPTYEQAEAIFARRYRLFFDAFTQAVSS